MNAAAQVQFPGNLSHALLARPTGEYIDRMDVNYANNRFDG
ncbi:MAG TPA: hypothetical protein VG308_08405 [Stellaceae bacterium]|nr:hypothetical protein [Stellaceae bacterium]